MPRSKANDGSPSPAAGVLLSGLPELRRSVLVEVLASLLDGVLHLKKVVFRFDLGRKKRGWQWRGGGGLESGVVGLTFPALV